MVVAVVVVVNTFLLKQLSEPQQTRQFFVSVMRSVDVLLMHLRIKVSLIHHLLLLLKVLIKVHRSKVRSQYCLVTRHDDYLACVDTVGVRLPCVCRHCWGQWSR